MASTSETGHAKNAANLQSLIVSVTGYGAAYNPSKTALQLPSLQILSTGCNNAIKAVNAAIPGYTQAVADRETAFLPLNKLATRVLNSIKATDTSTQVIENVQSLIRKIQGTRATPKKTDEEKAALAAEGKATKEISTSQMSFDNRLDNLDKLIQLLDSSPLYTPNETDLQVATLTTYLDELNRQNAAVKTAIILLSNARISRNEIMYKAGSSMVDIALDVKTYIKSVYGASSPQYKQVSKLAFKSIP
jgi:hypothetical protein